MNALFLRSVLLSGLLLAAINVIFAGVEYGFADLPAWFWLAQLLLLPAMLAPARMFPQAAVTRPYHQRAGLYALGWAAPYAAYKLTGDALRADFNPVASLLTVVLGSVLFGLLFAAYRRPARGE